MADIAPIPLGDLQAVGSGLERPECVLCTADGCLHVSDWRGGVTIIRPDGRQAALLARSPAIDLKPNGIALIEDGSYLLANLGGGVWRLGKSGQLEPFLVEVDGEELPPANFVLPDRDRRVWVTVSTRIEPRSDAYRPTANDGFIAVVDRGGARVVADGLGYTNEVQLHPSGRWLYVNETFARRTSRFPLHPDGELGPRETVTEYGRGTFPDGMCFEETGAFWVVSPVSNRLLRVDESGRQTVLVEDADPAHVDWVEAAFQEGTMGRPHFDTMQSERLCSTSSVAFGGRERRNCYLGCLLGDRLETFVSPVAGIEPVHWHWHRT